jgi:hypothetical protein
MREKEGKRLKSHCYALALCFVYYNFVRIQKSLNVSPAMAAGMTDKLWGSEDVIAPVDAKQEAAKKRGPTKRRWPNVYSLSNY